jgi:predicted dehydrogenase
MSKSLRTSRRDFIKTAGAAFAAPFFIPHLISAPPSERVRHASFGGDGMAASDWQKIASVPNVEIVSIAEIDAGRLGKIKEHYKTDAPKVYDDWREMLDKEHKNLDSVNVGTPDHMHAPIAMSAMQLGLHAYVQKPLAHDLYEVRRLTEFAREKKLVTQMGIQVHSDGKYRDAVALIRGGAIGKVKEVHTWSNKKWGDAEPPDDKNDPLPAGFNWDNWLGICAPRNFVSGFFHPFQWRKQIDFGTGTFGDMGCHIYDPVFESLGVNSPISLRSEGPAPHAKSWATNAKIHYTFPGTQFTDGKTVAVTWYDGDNIPPQEITDQLGKEEADELPEQGSIFIGTKGVMLLPHSEKRHPDANGKMTSRALRGPVLLSADHYKDYAMPKLPTLNHWAQFIDAVRGEGKTGANFNYAGPLTEAVLLGSVATFFPNTTLEWNGAKLKFKNNDAANKHIRRAYRKGWEVKGLS